MRDKLKGILIAGAAIAALAVGGAAIAGAAGGEGENEQPITGSALDKAKAAALESTGGGSVTETEVGDEEGAYEVEVKKTDGKSVDVHLDKGFNPIGTQADEEKAGEEDGSGEK